MNEALRVQESIKKNADELQQYFADMKTWENEIKEKEKQLKQAKCREPNMPFPRNIRHRKDPVGMPEVDNIQPTKKVKSQSETAADAANVTLKTDSYQNIDEAYFEKELGNKFVKEQKWSDAINCYTKAITLDPNNAVYFANRAMCYIKLGKWKLAEVDSTVAIQLDNTYVKAIKRRAFIRKTLNHDAGAREDYQRVLDLEPDCVEAQQEIADLTKRIEAKEANKAKPATFNYKNMFAASDSKKKPENSAPSPKPAAFNYKNLFSASEPVKKIAVENPEPPEKVAILATGSRDDNDQGKSIQIKPIVKPTHLRSKKPLQRVVVKQVEGRGAAWEYFEQNSPAVDDSACQIVTPERKEAGTPAVRILKPQHLTPIVDESKLLEALPKTYVQFVAVWRQTVDNHELRYKLLKAVCPTLVKIFGSSLEIDVLSEIIAQLMNEYFLRDAALLLDLLLSLSKVERLQSLILFLSAEDEKRLDNIFLQLARHYPEDVQKLRSTYFS